MSFRCLDTNHFFVIITQFLEANLGFSNTPETLAIVETVCMNISRPNGLTTTSEFSLLFLPEFQKTLVELKTSGQLPTTASTATTPPTTSFTAAPSTSSPASSKTAVDVTQSSTKQQSADATARFTQQHFPKQQRTHYHFCYCYRHGPINHHHGRTRGNQRNQGRKRSWTKPKPHTFQSDSIW